MNACSLAPKVSVTLASECTSKTVPAIASLPLSSPPLTLQSPPLIRAVPRSRSPPLSVSPLSGAPTVTIPFHAPVRTSLPAQSSLADRAAVVGNLHRHVRQWQASGADPLTLSWLNIGAPVLLTQLPRLGRPKPNIVSDSSQLEFIRKEVATMVALGAVSPVASPPAAVWQLMTAPKAGPRRYRLVVNMKPLTASVHSPAFKLERLDEFLLMLRPGDHIWTRDLRDGYFHLLMHPASRQLLGFQLDGQYFVYNVLPFGLRSAPFIFTKLMRTPLRVLRSHGLSCIGYIDDIVAASKPDLSHQRAQITDATLAAHGLVVADDKKQEPSTTAVALGLRIDTVLNRISLPEDKLTKTLSLVRSVLTMATKPSHRVDSHLVASLLGKLQWFSRAAPLARLYSRSLQFDLRQLDQCWSRRVVVSHESRKDLAVILRCAQQWNQRGNLIWRDGPTAQVFTDASDSGWGAALYVHGRLVRMESGVWSPSDCSHHINAKELQAVLLAVQAFLSHLTAATVEFRIDNITAVSYLRNAGGYFPHLVAIAKSALSLLLRAECQPSFHHLRGVLNVVADSLSRGKFVPLLTLQHGQFDPDDIQLHPALFKQLDLLWGPHSVDRFARLSSRHCPRFWSRVLEPGAEGINSLTADWSGDNNWVFPPFHMLLLVLRHIVRCKAKATVILPLWSAQAWWPLLTLVAVSWVPLPVHPFLLSGLPHVPRNPSWKFAAVRVDGSLFR